MARKQRHFVVFLPPIIAGASLIPLIIFWRTDTSVPFAQISLFVLALLALAFGFVDMLIRDVRHTFRDSIARRMMVIAVMVVEAVALFAVTYLEVSEIPGQITGMNTALDAVYFTMTTLMTIGFGDIAAEGQLARAVVLTQMLFTILVLSSSVRLLSSLVRSATENARLRQM